MPQQRQQQRPGQVQESSAPAPANVVAQRLCDLLLSFPCAAADGVQWRVLAARYEERYKSRLDLEAIGQSSAVGAATTLLWDVLRLVDKEDADNPVVGIEDGLALTPQPDVIACWPSMYTVLCDIVLEHGSMLDKAAAEAADRPAGTRFLLMSQLRPLLEAHWHAGFDETALSYRSEDGAAVVRFKKIKHFLQALLRWRGQRQAWQQASGCKPSAVDAALRRDLEVVPSKKHNDLMLSCRAPATGPATEASIPAKVMRVLLPDQDDEQEAEEEEALDMSTACGSTASASSTALAPDMADDANLRSELLRLRSENEKLRATNLQLQGSKGSSATATPLTSKRKARSARAAAEQRQKAAPASGQKVESAQNAEQQQEQQPRPVAPQLLPADLFDDPFEPPPEVPSWARGPQSSPVCRAPSEASTMDFCVDFRSSAFTSAATSTCASGAMTPIQMMQAPHPAAPQPFTQALMPVWFPFMQPMQQSLKGMMDAAAVIPTGIVQGARERFENIAGQ